MRYAFEHYEVVHPAVQQLPAAPQSFIVQAAQVEAMVAATMSTCDVGAASLLGGTP